MESGLVETLAGSVVRILCHSLVPLANLWGHVKCWSLVLLR